MENNLRAVIMPVFHHTIKQNNQLRGSSATAILMLKRIISKSSANT